MKNFVKYIGIFILMAFSFYYTEVIGKMIIYKSNLMNDILKNKDDYKIKEENAYINGDYIIPGLNGKEVAELESYYQMRSVGVFAEDKLAFSEIVPSISLNDNKDLIINKANSHKRKVSIIINNNLDVKKYLETKKIKGNILITMESFNNNSFLEQINIDKDYGTLDKIMSKLNMNTDLCYADSYNHDECLARGKYLIQPSYTISNSSLIKQSISSGDIILIADDLSLESFKILLQKIAYQNLQITYLSELISEKR